MLELLAAVADVAGVDPDAFQPEFAAARAGELERSCLDVSRARKALGLTAQTPLTEGLGLTMQWVCEFADR